MLLLFVAAAAFWSGFDQSGGSLNIFARDYTDLNFFGFEIPVSWVQVFNPIMVIIFAPMFAGFWAYLAKRSLDPSYPIKFVGGVFLMALSCGGDVGSSIARTANGNGWRSMVTDHVSVANMGRTNTFSDRSICLSLIHI